jgi:hypothetical protein
VRSKLLLATLVSCGPALASQWVSVVKGADEKTEIFLDVSSLRVAGDIRRAWVKTVLASHTVKGVGAAAHKWQSYTLVRTAFDCNNGAIKIEAVWTYYGDGTHDYASVPVDLWVPVPPDTMLDAEVSFICARKVAP